MPALTLILCSRNDAYMGNSRWRLETALNYLAAQVERQALGRNVEVLVADWGSDVPLREVVNLSADAARIVSFLHVLPDTARSLQGDSPFPEVLALNAAARRARGEFIGRIDQDTLVGGRFLETFFRMHRGAFDVGLPLDRALFFSNRRRIPYRFASTCPPFWIVDRLLERRGGRLHVEWGPSWAPFYVSSVGIWIAHRDRLEECGGYDERMIYMGAMDANILARLMQQYKLINLGEIVDYDFYHLEHYHPWAARSCGTYRRVNPDEYAMESNLSVMNPSGSRWGLADVDLTVAPARSGTAAKSTPVGRQRLAYPALVTRSTVSAAVEGRLIGLSTLPARVVSRVSVWRHRGRVAREAIQGQPVTAWPRALRRRWIERDRGALVRPTNFHRVETTPRSSGTP